MEEQVADYRQQQELEEQEQQMKSYEELSRINVNEHVEKKNGLAYLSWAWAVDQLLRQDPSATWEYREPVRWGDTVMVFCAVTAFGKTRTAQLPVMDHRNKAITNPDAMAVNTAMQRCLAKAIALHGIGLYIYAGEDVPLEEKEHMTAEHFAAIEAASDLASLVAAHAEAARYARSIGDALLEQKFTKAAADRKPKVAA